jgi:uncharacterized protein (DUF1499 family)
MNGTFPFLLCGVLILLQRSASCSADRQVPGRNLPSCPGSPNCVSSREPIGTRRVEPFTYQGTQVEARATLIALLHAIPRAKIVTADENFLHVEFRSAVFGFVDDVNILFDDGNKVIHVRSASRVGYYDFGVNRRRVEELRKRFMAAGKSNG